MTRQAISWRVRGLVMSENWYNAEQTFICNYCMARLDHHHVVIDHITPVARGGSDHPSNLQVVCARCNALKGDRMPDEAEEFINNYLEMEAQA